MTTAFDSQRFRDVLGQYPTGVCVVTAIQPGGEPAGMVVGSFTSVSLNPPLVAFLPDRSSKSWAKLRAAPAFCVNVLGAEQEDLCRTFAAKTGDKFAGVSWSPGPSGSPVLAGAVAWIDCRTESVTDAGDHDIVIGRVLELDVGRPGLPLLFFQGGYGRFTPLSFAAVERDLLDQLTQVDLVRPLMERLAADLDVECNAGVVVHNEFVHVAQAGAHRTLKDRAPRVGRRLPFRPPIGAPLAAWSPPERQRAWLGRAGAGSVWRTALGAQQLDRIKDRGFAVGLGRGGHDRLWRTASGHAGHLLDRLVDDIGMGYDQHDLDCRAEYDVAVISAPVRNRDGQPFLQLTLYGLPEQMSGQEVTAYGRRLDEVARAATAAACGG